MRLEWRRRHQDLPPGIARCWEAVSDNNDSHAGIMELMEGGKFMLVYRLKELPKATVERFDSVDLAMERANTILSTKPVRTHKFN